MANRRFASAVALSALAGGACLVTGVAAQAEERLTARYSISMAGISVGRIDWLVTISDGLYSTSATGGADGMLSALVSGKGAISATGAITERRFVPQTFRYRVDDDDGLVELQMSYEAGSARERITSRALPKSDRVAVTDDDRKDALDPLTALLIPADERGLVPETCNRSLPIFDGLRRYNLVLTYKRMDAVASRGNYSGPVLVCAAVLQPIAGHRASSLLIKYVAGRSDMEMWLAPLSDTALAPIRFVMPTLLGTLELGATRFEAASGSSSPAPLKR